MIPKPALKLLGCGTQRQISPGADQIDHGFGLSKIHFSVEKGALSELAGPRRSRPCSQARIQNLRGNQRATVTTDFDQIFTRVTTGRAMDGKHALVDQLVFCADDFAQMLNVRVKSGRLFFSAKDFIRNFDRIRTGNADQRNSAFTGWRRDCCDGVGNRHGVHQL